jgi:hypothetical protein
MKHVITAKWEGPESVIDSRVRQIMQRRGEWVTKEGPPRTCSVTVEAKDHEIGAFLGALRELPGVNAEHLVQD